MDDEEETPIGRYQMGGMGILTIIFAAVLIGAFVLMFVPKDKAQRIIFDFVVFLVLLLMLVGVLPG